MKPSYKLADYKALLFDYDSTLVDSQKQLPPQIPNLFKILSQKGFALGLCTARGWPDISANVKSAFGAKDTHIIFSGGVITRENKALDKQYLPQQVVKTLFTKLPQTGSVIITSSMTEIYSNDLSWFERVYCKQGVPPAKPLESANPSQIAKFVVHRLNPQARSLIAHHKNIETTFIRTIRGGHIDITLKNVTKASGVEKWGKATGISPDQIIGFGDNLNDVDFLKRVRFAVALGNAEPEVKAIAQRIIGHVDQNGLAVYLEKVIKTGEL